MLKKFSNPVSPLALYFREAPGDEGDTVSVTVAPRKNRGTDYNDDTNRVTVGPRANRGTDYGQEDEPEPAPAADTTVTPDTGGDVPDAPDTGGEDAATDYTMDGDAEGGDTGIPDPAAPGGTAPDTGGGDAGGGDMAGDDGVDGDAPDGPDVGDEDGDATDYTDDGGGEEGGDTGGDMGGGDAGGEMTEEEKAEAQKKFHMYKRFIHLYNLLEVFIEKCRNIVKPDATQNAVIKTVANNLSDLYDNLFDYMTIKYKSATYIQVLLYFETAISVIQLNFELLKNNKINLKQ